MTQVNTEVGVFRPYTDLQSTSAQRIGQVVDRFERGEVSFPEAQREMQQIVANLSEQDRDSLQVRSALQRFTDAASERARAMRERDGVDQRPMRPVGPVRQLATRLSGLQLPSGGQTAVDVAVSARFPTSREVLGTLANMPREAVERAVAQSVPPEDRERVLASLEHRVEMAFAEELARHVERRIGSLAQQLERPSRHAVGGVIDNLSGDAETREATLRGLEAMGMDAETREAIEALLPAEGGEARRALEACVRRGMRECAAGVRELQNDIASHGETIDQHSTGDLVARYPWAAQVVARRFGISDEAVRRSPAAIQDPSFGEQVLRAHTDASATRGRARDATTLVLLEASDIALNAAAGGGLAATLAELGMVGVTGAVELGTARNEHREAQVSFHSGMGGQRAADEADHAQHHAEQDLGARGANALLGGTGHTVEAVTTVAGVGAPSPGEAQAPRHRIDGDAP